MFTSKYQEKIWITFMSNIVAMLSLSLHRVHWALYPGIAHLECANLIHLDLFHSLLYQTMKENIKLVEYVRFAWE